MLFQSVAVFLISTLAVFSAPIPSMKRAAETPTTVGQVVCDNAAALSTHDCNVALLSLGGGIAGTIEELRVASSTNSATSGSCTVSITTTDGGNIDISKGRLEHGGVAGFDNLLDTCGGTPGAVLIQGGSTTGGNSLVTITAAA